MPALASEIHFIDIYGRSQTLRHPINFDLYLGDYYSSVGHIIERGLHEGEGVDYIVRALKSYRHALAYNAKVIKAVRKNVSIMPFYVERQYFSPFDLPRAQAMIEAVYRNHTKASNFFDTLINDFKSRAAIMRYYDRGIEHRKTREIEEHFNLFDL